jgi:hypothetical protein
MVLFIRDVEGLKTIAEAKERVCAFVNVDKVDGLQWDWEKVPLMVVKGGKWSKKSS